MSLYDETARVYSRAMRPCCASKLSLLVQAGFLASALLGSVCGCQTLRNVVDPLNISGLGKRPVRIGVTQFEFSPPPLLMPRTTLLQDDLFYHLHEPISFDLMTPRQIRVHLGTGRLRFAMLSAADYADVGVTENARILAVPLNQHGQTYRKGLVVVSTRSSMTSLKGVGAINFHFLSRGDVLNEAARGVVLESGLAASDLREGLLGLGLENYHLTSAEVVRSLALDNKAAGVIDEADYARWRKTGGSALLLAPSQDEVRLIAETVRVPEGPFLVSNETDPELTERVEHYLMNVLPTHKFVLASMGCTGFSKTIQPGEYEAFFEVHRKLHPLPPEPAGEQEADTQPASRPSY